METHEYTEEELRGKKYSELLVIIKKLGMSCRRVKYDKFIEAILNFQEDKFLESEAESIANEVAEAGEKDEEAVKEGHSVEAEKSEGVKEVQNVDAEKSEGVKEDENVEAEKRKNVLAGDKCDGDEELLSDIQLPELVAAEDEGSSTQEDIVTEKPNSTKKTAKKTGVRANRRRARGGPFEVEEEGKDSSGLKRRRTSTYDLAANKKNTDILEGEKNDKTPEEENASKPKRRRTSTFNVANEEKQPTPSESASKPKRRRTSTFEVTTTEEKEPTPSDSGNKPKQRKTSTYDVANNDKQATPSESASKLKRRTKRTSTFDAGKDDKQATPSKLDGTFEEPTSSEGDDNSKRRKTSTFDLQKDEQASEETDKTSDINQQETAENSRQLILLSEKLGRTSRGSPALQAIPDTPAATKSSENPSKTVSQTPATRAKEESRRKISRMLSLAKSKQEKARTPTSARKSQAGLKPDVNGKTNGVPPGTKILKPMFTVGRGDTSTKKGPSDGSNIPRFVSYARKLKVPNFAKIHEKAFKRMEALDEFDKRKKTNTVGSTKKLPQAAPEKVFQPSVTTVKNLSFNFSATKSPARLSTFSKPKTPGTEARKSIVTKTATAQKSAKKTPGLNKSVTRTSNISMKKLPATLKTQARPSMATLNKTITKTPTATKQAISKKQSPAENKKQSPAANKKQSPAANKKQSPAANKRQSPSTLKKVTIRQQSSQTQKKQTASVRKSPKVAIRTPKLKSPKIKTNLSALSAKLPQPKPQQLKENDKPAHLSSPALGKGSATTPESVAPKTKPTGYVPYKGPLRPHINREALKRLAEKNPNIKSRQEIRENQKTILKGVRFNKRFELQMANRGLTLQ